VTAPTGTTSTSPASWPEPPHLLDHAGRVGHRVGIGHRVHRGEPAERGRLGAALHGLGVLAAGLAQVGVQVDQARQRDQSVGLDDLGADGRIRGQRAVGDGQVGRLATERPDAPDQPAAHA
jgi:hypothetical protein